MVAVVTVIGVRMVLRRFGVHDVDSRR
jgi:hypothetical protein